jgi:hypothetical protein
MTRMRNVRVGIQSLLLAVAVSACLASSARAGIITFTGDTTGGSTFNRLLEDLSAQSAIGTAVRFNAFGFTVSLGGAYTFLTTGKFDTFGFLYQGSFDPTAPLANAVGGNDDLLGLTTSGFTRNLAAGTDYVYVTTGFGNNDFGAFSNTLGGPGDFVGVPGPAAPSDILTFTGNTSGDPTFNRPLQDLSGLSAIGTAVAYDTFTFGVTVSGTYTFLTTSAFDSFAFLYDGAFDPTAPLANGVVANDDLLGLTTSGFARALVAGSTYVLVTTAFGNGDFGAFSNTIGGPSALVVGTPSVPEPAISLLLACGAVAVARRRRPSR